MDKTADTTPAEVRIDKVADQWLVVGPGYWGRDRQIEQAIKHCRSRRAGDKLQIWRVDDTARIDMIGYMRAHVAHHVADAVLKADEKTLKNVTLRND